MTGWGGQGSARPSSPGCQCLALVLSQVQTLSAALQLQNPSSALEPGYCYGDSGRSSDDNWKSSQWIRNTTKEYKNVVQYEYCFRSNISKISWWRAYILVLKENYVFDVPGPSGNWPFKHGARNRNNERSKFSGRAIRNSHLCEHWHDEQFRKNNGVAALSNPFIAAVCVCPSWLLGLTTWCEIAWHPRVTTDTMQWSCGLVLHNSLSFGIACVHRIVSCVNPLKCRVNKDAEQ